MPRLLVKKQSMSHLVVCNAQPIAQWKIFDLPRNCLKRAILRNHIVNSTSIVVLHCSGMGASCIIVALALLT